MSAQELPLYLLTEPSFQTLIQNLLQEEFTLVGPQNDANLAIVYKEFESFDQLPRGLKDTQSAGHYRLEQTNLPSFFSQFTSGPQSAKNFLFPSLQKLFSIEKSKNLNKAPKLIAKNFSKKKYAFIGLRACEIAAIKLQDKVFEGAAASFYQKQRENIFIIGVECTSNVSSCFCADMNSGPAIQGGADLTLIEYPLDGIYRWGLRALSKKGISLVKKLKLPLLEQEEASFAKNLVQKNSDSLLGRFKNVDIKRLLYESHESSHWDDLATRCLACANCTLVCPTCFCSTIEDTQDLSGENAERWLKWESCFTSEHSQMHGQPVRDSVKSRYRQWMTHKFASWQDQFGSSGCTGCGKCVTWCPVAIDVRVELNQFQKSENV